VFWIQANVQINFWSSHSWRS